MRILLVGVAIVVVLIGGFVVWRLWATYSGGRAAYLRLAEAIGPVERQLRSGHDPDPVDLERFARDRATRRVLYDALDHHGKLGLFPPEYLTPEAMAEADLVAWLVHPNELAAPPDEIELMASLPAPGSAFAGQRYFVFRYRTRPPHWAAADGWLAGVAGPYPREATFASGAPGTFSRFESYDSRTPEDHVRVTHELVMARR